MHNIRTLSWNLNWVTTYEIELLNILRAHKPDVIVLCDTRADARPTFSRIWPGAKVEQILPISQGNSTAIASMAVVIKPVGEMILRKRIVFLSVNRNELVQAIKERLEQNTSVAGIYAGPQTSGKKHEEALKKINKDDGGRVILVGDLHARHKEWDKITNTRRTTVVKAGKRRNYKI